MAIRLSYEAEQKHKTDAVFLARLYANTEFAFKLCRELGLQEERNFRAQAHRIQKNTDTLLALLSSDVGVDVHAQDKDTGETLLHCVATQFFPPFCVVDALLRAGADISAQRRDTKETPLLVALHHMQQSLHALEGNVKALEALYAVQQGHGGVHTALLRNVYDDRSGRKKLVSVAEQLLSCGADLYVADAQGHHALDGAISLEDWPRIGDLVRAYDEAGRAAARQIAAGQVQHITPHQLLKCANVSLLRALLSSQHWPYDFAQTDHLMDGLAPCLKEFVAQELTVLLLTKSEPDTLVHTASHGRMFGPEGKSK